MSLADWQKNSWLVEHETSPEEIAGLADDWKLNIAYNAALQAATAALAAAGFRAAREQHHYRTIQSLALTINWPTVKIARLDRFRQKRNIGGHEIAGLVSEREAREMHELAAASETIFSPGCGKITPSGYADKS